MPEPTLERVTLTMCSLCLDGKGGECHTPGCALWMNRAPDVTLRSKIEAPAPVGETRDGGLRDVAADLLDVAAALEEPASEAVMRLARLDIRDLAAHVRALADVPASPIPADGDELAGLLTSDELVRCALDAGAKAAYPGSMQVAEVIESRANRRMMRAALAAVAARLSSRVEMEQDDDLWITARFGPAGSVEGDDDASA